MHLRPADVGIVTTTYYPDPHNPVQQVRARLAASALRRALDDGHVVTVIDGGSHPDLLDLAGLRSCGATVRMTRPELDMVLVRQHAMRAALDEKPSLAFAIWTEPEKDITPWALEWAQYAAQERAAVVLPMRESMISYPLVQQISERRGNEELAECFGRDVGDHYFGPRLFTADAVRRHWLRPYEEYGTDARRWAAIFSPVFGALAAGERVVAVTVPFVYPSKQCVVEQNNVALDDKRLMQRTTITQAAVDIRDALPWHADWELTMPAGFALAQQAMSAIDLRKSESQRSDKASRFIEFG